MVYVLDTDGKPLMPTERHGKVRRLLRDGLACVVRLQPFTIQLTYESKRYTQEVSLGIDAGSVHIGVSATTEKRELFSSEVVMRTDIVKKLASRRELRKGRRFRKTRYRAERFDNRRKGEGWLAPSIRYKVDSHLKVIRLSHSILPISKTTIEVAQFDAQKIKNDSIQGVEYQQGEQMGFWNVREYVLARDGHKCQHCKGKSGDKVLNVHHLESRKIGGNTPSNLITLCETCHKAYHRGEIQLKQKRGTSLRDAAAMNVMRWAVYDKAKAEFDNVHLTFGYITKHTRIENGVEKSHNADAYCIAKNVQAERLSSYLKVRLLSRHNRALHVCNPKRGGIRRGAVASHWIGKSRLQRFDTVVWNGIKCFIFGSTKGRLILRDNEGALVTPTAAVNAKNVIFINRNNGFLMVLKQNSI
jgi:N6-L-threonylcarbamoyladenine synthase